ncbi:MAG: hypothetical protein LUH11_01980, partial [Candidatus Gastranaerophilales bacterium]|nr:hypothetical protein [Candidatus Gastranaerophilales bacterium]
NKYFKTNIEEEKGTDIYTNSAEKIIKYLKKIIKTCKYCTWGGERGTLNSVKFIPWSISKKDENEWY